MKYKRLRSGKTIESKKASELSEIAKERTSEALRSQHISLMKLFEENPEVSEEIRSSGYYILRTVTDMNEYFSAVSGSYSLAPKKIELAAFLMKFCEKAEPFLTEKSFAIMHSVNLKNVFVEADAEKLLGVIANLVRNAMENSPAGTRIRVSLSVTKKFAKITVGDKGFGMDEETILRCCEPFYKNSADKKNKMGLGLTLAHHFAAESGGRISIRSEEGKGTAVSVLLPIMPKEKTLVAVESPVSEIFGERNHIIETVFADIKTE